MTVTASVASVTSKGLTVDVLRPKVDGTAGGVSAQYDTLTVIGYYAEGDCLITPLESSSQVFTPNDRRPAVALRVRYLDDRVVEVVPVEVEGDVYVPVNRWMMAGGNYASSYDSRLGALVNRLLGRHFCGALPIHDRIEG